MDYVKSEIVTFDKTTGARGMLMPMSLKPTDPNQGWVALPADFNEATFTWNATTRVMVEDLAKVKAQLLAGVKAEAELRKMAVLSPGGAKKTEYADQAAEVRFFWSLGGTVAAVMLAINAMPAERRLALFPCATDNAAEFGDTIDKAIARFAAGMRKSGTRSKIAAREQKVCAALDAATTIAAARAAAVVTWPS